MENIRVKKHREWKFFTRKTHFVGLAYEWLDYFQILPSIGFMIEKFGLSKGVKKSNYHVMINFSWLLFTCILRVSTYYIEENRGADII